jgi:hypothetical protein
MHISGSKQEGGQIQANVITDQMYNISILNKAFQIKSRADLCTNFWRVVYMDLKHILFFLKKLFKLVIGLFSYV